MGTWLDVTVRSRDREHALEVTEAVFAAVEESDRRLSTWHDDSELTLVNREGATREVAISRPLARDLSDALEWSRRTSGTFNPAIGSLVDVWGLRGGGRIPTDDELRDALSATRVTDLRLRDGSIRLERPGLRIEEGGFGKGAALRDALDAARRRGPTCVVLDFGGQVAVDGGCDGTSIGIADPRERTSEVAILTIASGSVASSGLSQRSFDVGANRFGHILDPRDGRPAQDWGAVTVVASDPLAADCVATALFVMGPEDGAEWAASQPEIEAVFVQPSNGALRLRATAGMRSRLQVPPGTTVDWIPDVEACQNGSPPPVGPFH